jgi:Sporulation and spore germination
MPSPATHIRNALVVLTAAALAVSFTGCAQLPTSSKVLDGPSVQDGQNSDYLYYSPSGPTNGQTQVEVINSFLNAATGPQNDYQTAREFLAPDFKAKWSPNDEVLIQQGSLTLASLPDNAAAVSINVAATVDADGHYQANAQPVTRILDFKLVQVNGQWRISQAPNAIVLIRPVFDVIFHSYSVYFFDHSYSYLVPDLRWFPSRASTATRLVTALLAGPTPWLAGAVESTMPADTKLAIDAVTVDKGVAQVSLNAAALMASQSAKQYFLAQLQSAENRSVPTHVGYFKLVCSGGAD